MHLFAVNSEGQLQLNASEQGQALIHTPLNSSDVRFWQLDLALTFAPSQSNQLKIYLWLDQMEPEASGFFLQLGESGDRDKIRLFRLDDGMETELAESASIFGDSPEITLQVLLNENQLTLQSKSSETPNFQDQFSYQLASNVPRNDSDVFAISCAYTSTRIDRFFFDNIDIRQEAPVDSTGPIIIELQVLEAQRLVLQFSEALERTTAENTENYRLEPEGIFPTSAVLDDQKNQIALEFNMPFTPNQALILVASNLADLQGNLATSQREFVYEVLRAFQPYELLINEIYDDPTPSFGLPAAEFLELLATPMDGGPLDLGGIVLRNFNSEIVLPSKKLASGSHLIICEQEDSAQLSSFGEVLGIDGFPTLINAGNDLSLISREGLIIHRVAYNDTWYQDNSKNDGGWSLELIDPTDPCALQQNWRASESLNGGTPGSANSIFNAANSQIPFLVNRVVPTGPDRILVHFNKAINDSLMDRLKLSGGTSQVVAAVRGGRNLEQAILIIDPPLQPGNDYSLQIDGLVDCNDQVLSDNIFEVLIPNVPNAGELVINELLFNPAVGGADFVEIHNPTEKAFAISDLALGTRTGQSQQIRPIISSAIIPPGGFFVFTPNPTDIEMRYPPVATQNIFLNPLPSLPDRMGDVTLIYQGNGSARILDALVYEENFHSNILRDREGVSLERIDPLGVTQDPANWHSAASTVGFATPTQMNSQSRMSTSLDQGLFSIEPARLSPDGDGFEDFLEIRYSLPTNGTIASIRIFDANGRLIKFLLNNESLATSGQIKWDGDTDDGSLASIGIYTILIETFDEQGFQQKWKETCVLAGILD